MKTCYLCNSTKNLTKDHIPPKGFFPPNRRENLITVTCCNDCHEKLSLDDEAFRIFASANISRSEEGTWIWDNKVMKSSFERSPKLKKNVKKSLIKTKLITSKGVQLSAITIPDTRVINFLTRLTKGLITHHSPELSYSHKKFTTTMIIPSQDIVDNVLNKFVYAEIGKGVFRYWRAYTNENGKWNYVWIFVFYDGAMFMVEVD